MEDDDACQCGDSCSTVEVHEQLTCYMATTVRAVEAARRDENTKFCQWSGLYSTVHHECTLLEAKALETFEVLLHLEPIPVLGEVDEDLDDDKKVAENAGKNKIIATKRWRSRANLKKLVRLFTGWLDTKNPKYHSPIRHDPFEWHYRVAWHCSISTIWSFQARWMLLLVISLAVGTNPWMNIEMSSNQTKIRGGINASIARPYSNRNARW